MSKKKQKPEDIQEDNNTTQELKTEAIENVDANQELEIKLKDQEDKFLRLYADFENYRRRASQEKLEYLSSANKEMIVAMLPILDDFERAIKNNEQVTDASVLKEGFSLIANKLNQILESKGLKPIDSMHQPFDYDLHEAIANVPVEDANLKGKVIDQVEKGYFLNDKVIRFSKVAVGQ